MYSSAYVWAKVLGHLEANLTDTVISSWFDDVEVLELSETRMILYSPSQFRRDLIERRCMDYMKEALSSLFQYDNIEILVYGDEEASVYHNSKKQAKFTEFNKKFTFDNFVVGSSNQFAHAAALAVANNPAEAYNPLFLYGPSGLGKTHLLYAIANVIHDKSPSSNIVYLKGDQFTNELIAAVQAGQNEEFRNKYRGADLFLMDDIQFISGKIATQEEFFHTFNNLYEAKKQIVVTSDRPPNEMLKLEDRLKTRFEWGLLADIQPPDYETRMAIIQKKALSLGLEMPNDVCSYIADNVTTNVRQIEGTVHKILAYRDLANMPLDVTSVSRAIKDMYKGKAEMLPTPDLIITEVSRYYNVEVSVLRSALKTKGTSEARQVAMYLIRKLTNLSFPDIGKEFGKDHTTVIYAVKKVETALKKEDGTLADNIKDISASINNNL